MEHTTGKLTFRGFSIYAADGKTPVADTCLNASVAQHDVANARRLVAAWNACEGASTDWLEAQTDPSSEELFGKVAPFDKRLQAAMLDAEAAKVQRDALKAQRDELLAGLERAIDVMGSAWAWDEVEIARALIAKHKGAEHG